MSQVIQTDSRFSISGQTIIASNGYFERGVAIIPDAEEYFPDNSLVPSWNRGKPKFMRFLQMILDPLYAAMDVFNNFNDSFSIDNAVGDQLDMIGRLLGCTRVLPVVFAGYSRTLDNDDDYRLLIKATIAQQHWDGTLQGLVEIATTVFSGFDLSVIDNQDGSFKIRINSTTRITGVQMQMILSDLLFPHAAGIKMYVDIPASIEAASVGISGGVYEVYREKVSTAEV